MASATRSSSLSGRSSARVPAGQGSRFDRRLAKILEHATEVFCEKGYEGASMRDLSRASRMSLAGLYYYFDSKEKLLYLIQKYTFSTILERLRERLEGVEDPEQRVRIFIQNHLEYFLANQKAVKVLSHEDDVLKNGYGAEIAAIKREYYRICLGLVDELKREQGLEFSSRIAVLSLFGMMNWIYTWQNPRVDADAGELARQMGDIFLHGACRGDGGSRPQAKRAPGSKVRVM
jgi:AcrR family transcriptional regulator